MHLVAQPHTEVGAKQEVHRQWLTAAGVAVVTAGMIAASPGFAPVPATTAQDMRADSVRLTAGWDPFAPWNAAILGMDANGKKLTDNFLLAPGVGLQQAVANQIGYVKGLADGSTDLTAVAEQITTNAVKVLTALTLQGVDDDVKAATLKRSLAGLHGVMFDQIPGFLPESIPPEIAGAVVNFLGSPLSGVMIGFAGPVISPAIALLNSSLAIADALKSQDMETVLHHTVDIPGNMVNAFLNGATLNLDFVVPILKDAGVLPENIDFNGIPVTIDGMDFAFGGLLTPGVTGGTTYEVKDEEGEVINTITAPGGSMFNALGLDLSIMGTVPLPIKAEAVGPIGALIGLSQTVGVLLGSNWDNPSEYAPEWDGKGTPPPPPPPLFGLEPQAIGDVLSGAAESVGIAKFSDALKGAAVENIVKKLRGGAAGTEEASDSAAAPATDPDGPAANTIAAVTELTHATTNKTVTVSVEQPAAPASTADATTTATTEAADSDVTAGATTASADDAADTGTKAPKAQKRQKAPTVRSDQSNSPQRNLVKGVKDAVKNVRNGLGGNKSRTSNESGSSSSDSSAGSSGTNSSAKKDSAKSDSKKDSGTD